MIGAFISNPGPPHLLAAGAGTSAVELLAAALLGGAVIALLLAVRSAAGRSPAPGPGGVEAGEARQAAEELKVLITEARAASDELAQRFDRQTARLAAMIRQAEQISTPDHDGRFHAPEDAPPARDHPVMGGPAHRVEPKPVGPPAVVSPAARDFSEAETSAMGDPMTREIYRLADQGFAPLDIATRLGQHTGKVELILALRRA